MPLTPSDSTQNKSYTALIVRANKSIYGPMLWFNSPPSITFVLFEDNIQLISGFEFYSALDECMEIA
jgi:hypothetical protein